MKNLLVTVLMTLGISGLSLLIYDSVFKESYAYMDTHKVFNDFTLKKELENEFKKVENQRKAILDTMLLELKVISNAMEAKPGDKEIINVFESRKQAYVRKEEEFKLANQSLSDQYDGQIWNQLNAYVKEYGKQKRYQLIFGVTGDGSLMYADEGKDVSSDVVEFINKRYEGK